MILYTSTAKKAGKHDSLYITRVRCAVFLALKVVGVLALEVSVPIPHGIPGFCYPVV